MTTATAARRAATTEEASDHAVAGRADLLRLATAGSVDDGKSTLVGRLLYDTKSVLADQIDAVTRASVDKGLDTPDLSLLVDGLRAEREQGITIDVAYRYFATPARSFILADTPGHVQYTRNTVTGASTADVVVLLVDARNGIVPQTRRHAAVLALLGVPRVVLAVNKIDLVDDAAAVYAAVTAEFAELTASLGWTADRVQSIPVSALHGDNVAVRSEATDFYTGPTLIEHLEQVPPAAADREVATATGLRLPVQYVIRPRTAAHPDYRGYAGQVAAGTARVGDEVVVLPSGVRTRIAGIDTPDGGLTEALPGRSVTVRLADDVDVARGDLIAAVSDAPEAVRQTFATVCWLTDTPLTAGTRLLVKHGARTVLAIVERLESVLDEQSLTVASAPERLGLNDLGTVALRLAEELPVDPHTVSRTTSALLLIDADSGDTLGAGLVGDALTVIGAQA